MKAISCGFLIHDVTTDKYLLCHATQSGKTSFIDGNWTIPKGVMDDGETDLQCAIRETYEETGINLLDFVSMDKLSQCTKHVLLTKKKDIHVFTLHTDDKRLVSFDMRCTSIIDNPTMPHMNGLPEVDQFGWFDANECKGMVFNSLKQLF